MTRTLALALALALTLAPVREARAAVNGNIAGIVTDKASGRPLAGATVTIAGAAAATEQTEFTDSSGRYLITELPPGEYVVRVYYANLKVERTGVVLNADRTLQVNVAVPTGRASETVRIVERAPSVDVGSTQVTTTITSDLWRNVPLPGDGFGHRTYGSLLTRAPGATTETIPGEPTQYSWSGATGPENNYLLDGINTTSPTHGLLGTPLSLEFIGETEVITGGYNAEYGRATGGVVNLVTKSGSNEFHGGAWLYYQPLSADARPVARNGEAVEWATRLASHYDFGFDLGGPIVKDAVWFYVGFHPQFSTFETVRTLRARTADGLPATAMDGSYAGDVDGSASCGADVPAGLCVGGQFKTAPLSDAYAKKYATSQRLYSWILKLDFQLNPNNKLTLQYVGSPSTSDGIAPGSSLNGAEGSFLRTESRQAHDVAAHLVSKLLDRRLQADLLLGLHYESRAAAADPTHGGDAPSVVDARTAPLARYEDVAPCAPTTLHGVAFDPCPVSSYNDGGYGYYFSREASRVTGALGLTVFGRLAGAHAVKLGGDFEANQYKDVRAYTGGAAYSVGTDGSVARTQLGTLAPDGSVMPFGAEGFASTTKTYNEALYLRDSWNVGFVPGLTLNAGLRWELQQLKDSREQTVIDIPDNLAPRVGFIYDWTQKGRSKLYASYGRFYESIPLDINDRQFSGEGTLTQFSTGGCPSQANGADVRVDPTKCTFASPRPGDLSGGANGVPSPVLKGQYSDEVVAGIQYDVGLDLVLGAAYVHRELGRIIEDISPGNGAFIIANPGDPTDPSVVAKLQAQIDDRSTSPAKRAQLQQQLALYRQVSSFEKPKRNYDALVVTATKRFSSRFVVLASYTYARSVGNYPGLYQGSTGQLDPNISTQYDLRDLLVNRDGPLPNDRPHNFKADGAYTLPIGEGGLTLGLGVDVLSGAPVDVLGAHPTYGREETFILPRGAGGRTPTLWTLNAHLAYHRQLSRVLRVEVYADVFNCTNNREAVAVDAEYTADPVEPIAGGTVADLKSLRTVGGAVPVINSNYRQPTAYQAPASARFGVRVSF